MAAENVWSAFEASGIFPLNTERILRKISSAEQQIKDVSTTASSSRRGCCQYVAGFELWSPADCAQEKEGNYQLTMKECGRITRRNFT